MPAYREAGRIATTVDRIRNELGPLVGIDDLEIVVVDDGSSDGTAEAARAAGAHQVVVQPVNQGKGAAVRAGVKAATGRTVAFTDADLAYSPSQVHRLLVQVEAGWDVVVGSRYHHDTTTVVPVRRVREVGGRLVNVATRIVLVGDHADTQCGMKAFRSDVARVLFSHGKVDGFAFDVELYLLTELYGFSLVEVPVEVENSERSTVNVVRDAVRLLTDLGRIRRSARAGVYDLDPGELDGLAPGPADSGE